MYTYLKLFILLYNSYIPVHVYISYIKLMSLLIQLIYCLNYLTYTCINHTLLFMILHVQLICFPDNSTCTIDKVSTCNMKMKLVIHSCVESSSLNHPFVPKQQVMQRTVTEGASETDDLSHTQPGTYNKDQTAMMLHKLQCRTKTACQAGHKHRLCHARSNLRLLHQIQLILLFCEDNFQQLSIWPSRLLE